MFRNAVNLCNTIYFLIVIFFAGFHGVMCLVSRTSSDIGVLLVLLSVKGCISVAIVMFWLVSAIFIRFCIIGSILVFGITAVSIMRYNSLSLLFIRVR